MDGRMDEVQDLIKSIKGSTNKEIMEIKIRNDEFSNEMTSLHNKLKDYSEKSIEEIL
jgi:uncharacterized protein YeeX (DUF496 family)